MKSLYIKNIAITVASLFVAVSASAQDMTTYFMPNVVDNKNHNASFAPSRGYFNIPIVGSTTLSTNGNVSLGNLIYPVDGENLFLLDPKVSATDALSGLKPSNYFGVDSRLTLLGFGKYLKDKKSFITFDLGLRASGNFTAPYELFEFLKTTPDQMSINNSTNLYLDTFVEAAFGYSRPITNKLTVGTRVKLLAGLMNAEFDIEQMNVTLSSEEWNVQAKGFLDLNSKGTTIESSLGESGEIFEMGDLETKIKGVSGFGAAIDLGATYDFSDRLHFSAAANDIGFIVWGKGGNTSAVLSDEFVFTGADINIDESGAVVDDDSTTIDLDELEFQKQASKSSTKWLQGNINLGAEYDIFGDLLSVGAVYSSRFWRTEAVHTFTAAATTTPLDWFTFAASYSTTNTGSNSMGLAANIATKHFINLYVSTDIMFAKKSVQLVPVNQTMMNVSFGLAVPLARAGER